MTLSANPYQASRPITDSDDLFGRKTEFELMYQMLLSHESVNVMGTRRIGKSSFLRVLPQVEMQQRLFEKPVFDERYVFAYIDMESQKATTPVQFLSKVAKQFKKRGLEIKMDIQSYEDFEMELEQCRDADRRLILLLDEFDCATDNAQFDVTFYDMLRYYQQEDLVSYIVASSRRVKEVAKSTVATSPFFNIFRFLHLGLLRDEEASDLICKDDSLSLYTHFVKLIAGRHPFFISQLCFYLFYFKHTAPDAQTEDAIRNNAIERFIEEAFDHFVYYWEHLSTDERAVLKKLTNGKQPNDEDAPELRSLEQKALIQEDSGMFRIFSAAFAGFVKEVEYSETGEKLSEFLKEHTKALVSITRYCIDKAVALKK